jgi:hypothetical protein
MVVKDLVVLLQVVIRQLTNGLQHSLQLSADNKIGVKAG